MRILLPLLTFFVLFACGNPQSKHAVITGQIENPTGTTVEVFYYKNFITNAMEKVEVELDENNSFSANLPLTEGQFAYLRMDKRSIMMYLRPGAEVNIDFDASDNEALPMITGTKALESSFLATYNNEIGSKYNRSAVLNKTVEMSPADFAQYVDGIHTEKTQYMEQFEGYEKMDDGFVSQMQTNLLFEKKNYLLDYPAAFSRYNPGVEVPEMPEDYYNFLEDENLIQDENTNSRQYFSFLGSYLNYCRTQSEVAEGDDRSYFEIQYHMARDVFTGKSRDMMLSQLMVSALNFSDFDIARELYADYDTIVATPSYKEAVQGEYNAIMALSPGKPAPDFTLTDINGQQVSLSDYAGKVVYLDFWASWCGPCMREMPHAKELKKRLEGQDDIVYLYVSVDTDEAAWRKTVEEHDIQGVHLNVAGFDHEVPSVYNLKGVPTFYLIGRDGMIYDNRPPRPSNKLIDEMLLTALAQ